MSSSERLNISFGVCVSKCVCLFLQEHFQTFSRINLNYAHLDEVHSLIVFKSSTQIANPSSGKFSKQREAHKMAKSLNALTVDDVITGEANKKHQQQQQQ